MKILHLDIETAPHKVYAWGLWKQNISINQIEEAGFTLCWAAKWHGEPEIFFNSVQESSSKEMLQEIHALISEADAVVHYNGTGFDMPTLNQEFLLHGMAPPAPYKQIDLLKTARSQFRLPSNKLDYVARHLNLGSKLHHKGMPLWTGCMDGNEADWKVMKRYNIQDVKLLEKVYKRLLPWINNHPNVALYKDTKDRPVCTNCGSHHVQSRGTAKTSTMEYQRFQCNGCGKWLRGRTNTLTKTKKASLLISNY